MRVCVRLVVVLAIVLALLPFAMGNGSAQMADWMPAREGAGRLERKGPDVVLHLAGTPEELGRQHGRLLRGSIRTMIRRYVRPALEGDHGRRLLAGVNVMRGALPKEYLAELDACAEAAGVDKDALLIAQCLGDLESAIIGMPLGPNHACSSYVAFGPATADGSLQCGRNFDYFLADGVSTALVTYFRPARGQGYAFAAVGMPGLLGGWTLVNERGLVVANHLGGGVKSRLDAIPTLILTRLIAQHAGTVEEAVRMI